MKDSFLLLKSSVLEELSTLSGVLNLAGLGIEGQVEDLKQQFQKELSFTVLCLGDFNSGKTSFVNKFILGNSLLPVGVLPTTAKITTIRYGETLSLTLKLKSGLEEQYVENIAEIAAEAGAKDGAREGETKALEVRVPSERLKEGVIIVDSPGLNDPEIERSKVTSDYLDRCDCIWVFLYAPQAWKRSEQEFIEENIFSKKHFNKIFFLLNFWDLIDEQERSSVLNYVKQQMDKSIQILKSNLQGEDDEVKEPVLVPVSAKTGENMEHLEKVLWDYLADKRGPNLLTLKIQKIFSFIDAALERIGESVEVYKKERLQVETDIEQLKIEVEKFAKDVETFRAKLYEQLTPAWQGYVTGIDQLHTDLEGKISQAMQNAFRSIGAFTDKVELGKMLVNRERRVLHQHKAKFQALERSLIETSGDLIRTMKADLNLRQISLIEFQVNNKGIELENLEIDDYMVTLYGGGVGMVTAAFLLGSVTGGIGALLAPVVLALTEKYRIDQIRKALEDQLPELEANVSATLAGRREEIVQSRQKIFEKIFENTRHEILELYREKNELLTQAIKNKKENIDQEILARAENSKSELIAIKNRLTALVKKAV